MSERPRVSSGNHSCVYVFGETAKGTRLRLPGDRMPRSITDFSEGAVEVLNHATDERCDWSPDDVEAFLGDLPAAQNRCVLTGAEIDSWLERRFRVSSA
jgi:hypothetical protein